MFKAFRQWIRTREGISTFDAITYGWILGMFTMIAAFKSGLLMI